MFMKLAMMTIIITIAMQSYEWIPNVGAIKYFVDNKGWL